MIKTDDPKTQTIALLKGYGPFSFIALRNIFVFNTKPKIRNALKDCKSEDWDHQIR